MILPIILSLGAAAVALLALGKKAGAAPPEGYIPDVNDILGAQNMEELNCWYEYIGELYITDQITQAIYTNLYNAYLTRWDDLATGQSGYMPGEIIVMFVDGATAEEINQLIESLGCSVIDIGAAGLYRIAIPDGTTVEEMVDLFLQSPIVEYAEPNYVDVSVLIRQEYRYENLPSACVCDNCGYVLENPGEHCRDIICPSCGNTMWRLE